MKSAKRYKVVDGSQTGHCCFDATIVDTTIPVMVGGEQYKHYETGELQFSPVCECYEEKDAILICKALNGLKAKPVVAKKKKR